MCSSDACSDYTCAKLATCFSQEVDTCYVVISSSVSDTMAGTVIFTDSAVVMWLYSPITRLLFLSATLSLTTKGDRLIA